MGLRIALGVLILAAAALAFLLVGGGRGADGPALPAPVERRPALRDDPAVIASPPPASAAELAPRREAAPVETEPLAEVAAIPAAGPRLRGVLRHSSDGRPVAGAALVFWQGEEFREAVTDADGAFATEPGLAAGAVRVWHSGRAPQPSLLQHREVRPETLLLAAPAAGADFEPVELELVDPPAWVEVEVVRLDGRPAPAELRWLFRPPTGGGTMMRAPTDERGQARVPFPRLDPGSFLLLAACTAEEVSEIARVEAPPGDERLQLVLDEGGRVRARVREADGRPRADQQVNVEEGAGLHRLLDRGARTGADGVALVAGLRPGEQRVWFHDQETSQQVRATVTVERGLTAEVELRLPEVPIAASGRVLDAAGEPLDNVSIVATIGERSTSVETGDQGTFTIPWKRERGPVRVTTEPGLTEDRYEPAAFEVPFGTRDLVFQRLETRPTETLALEVVEQGSDARIPGVMVLGFLEPGRASWSFHRGDEGLVTLQLKRYDDVALAIEAVGHRRRIVRAVELLEATPAGQPCRVALAPGLERWLQVLDEEDDAPLLDARILDGERLVATTDADGRALIELAHWPAELRVEAAGHAPGRWTCKDWLTELGDGVLWLARAPVAAAPR